MTQNWLVSLSGYLLITQTVERDGASSFGPTFWVKSRFQRWQIFFTKAWNFLNLTKYCGSNFKCHIFNLHPCCCFIIFSYRLLINLTQPAKSESAGNAAADRTTVSLYAELVNLLRQSKRAFVNAELFSVFTSIINQFITKVTLKRYELTERATACAGYCIGTMESKYEIYSLLLIWGLPAYANVCKNWTLTKSPTPNLIMEHKILTDITFN